MIAVLYAAAMAVLVLYGVNLLWLSLLHARQDRRRVREHTSASVNGSWPYVTVQIPLYNESLVARRVIEACAALDYPRSKLQIQVLDDSTDETVSIAAREVMRWQAQGLDIEHVSRKHRQGFKAGALANGLRTAKGTLIAVFDADFLPPHNFLLRLVPEFQDARIGMVQARWGHLNAADSLLTRVQACALDVHFALEQVARNSSGYFMNFNGTAGIWRAACIAEAGGWQGDTLAEDIDLSYRAQLKGWNFKFVQQFEAPAELPISMGALRTQQFRWAKGTAEAARKLLGHLWRSPQRLGIKLQATLHLTAHAVFPCLALAALLHAPLVLLEETGHGPGAVYFGCMGIGLAGLLGFFLAQSLAQRALYPDWLRRILFFPIFMAGTMALAASNSRALWQALRRYSTPFVRTPKVSANRLKVYRVPRATIIIAVEAVFAAYSILGLAWIIIEGIWPAAVFQTFFAMAFVFVTLYNVRELR